MLHHKYDLKREMFSVGKWNRVNSRRLMKNNINTIDDIRDIFIEVNKGIISDEEIYLVTNKYKILLNEMDFFVDLMIIF